MKMFKCKRNKSKGNEEDFLGEGPTHRDFLYAAVKYIYPSSSEKKNYERIIWNFIWYIELNDGVYCDAFNKVANSRNSNHSSKLTEHFLLIFDNSNVNNYRKQHYKIKSMLLTSWQMNIE